MIGAYGFARDESLAEPRKERRVLLGLAALALISEALYLRLVRFDAIDGWRPVATFVGFMMALFAIYGLSFLVLRRIRFRRKAALIIVVLGAAAFRVTLIPAGLPPDASVPELTQLVRADLHGDAVSFDRYLLYDDDVWRYLWDGHVWANSVDPFRFAPADERLDYLAASPSGDASDVSPLWQDIRDNVNHAQIPTIYPPLAQVVFRLSHALAPGSVIVLKTILISCDLLTILLVYLVLQNLELHPAWLLLYAWNPLLIKVVAGSGHIDVLAGTLLTLTAYLVLKRIYSPAALALAGAALVKFAPLVVFPFLARRIGWRRSLVVPVIMGAAYVPFWHSGLSVFAGFTKFAREWQFNSVFFLSARSLVGPFVADPLLVARGIGVLAILAAMVWFWRRDDGQPASFPQVASYVLGLLIVLSPTVMPWYFVWLLPLAVVSQATIWLWFTVAVCLAFFVMANGTLSAPVLAAEYGLLLTIALLALHRQKRKQTPAPTETLQLQTAHTPVGVRAVLHNNRESTPWRKGS